MSYRSSLRRAIACLSLSACLLVGCAGQSAPTASQTSSSVTISQKLNDGQLRALYGNVVSVLCGNRLLYESSPSESVELIFDNRTGEYCYYSVSSNKESGTDGRITTFYDKQNNIVCQFDGNCYAQLYGENLVVCDSFEFWEEMQEQHYRIRSLATGEEWNCPAQTTDATISSSGFVVLTVRDEDCDTDHYNRTHVEIYDPQHTLIQQIDNAYFYTPYFYPSYTPIDWVALSPTESEEERDFLLNVVTSETLPDYTSFCGEDFACFGTSEEGYSVRSLSSGEEVAHYPHSCVYYNSEFAVLWNSDDYTNYFCNNDLPDTLCPLKEYTLGDNGLVLLGADGSVSAYRFSTRESLYLPQDIDPASYYAVWADDMSADGSFVVRFFDDSYSLCGIRSYAMDGSSCILGQEIVEQYHDISPICSSPSQALFYGTYDAPAHSVLYNVFDGQGNIVLHGLSSVYSLENLPSNAFYARKGFREGWMDTSGEWLFSRSIFSLTTEDTPSYY